MSFMVLNRDMLLTFSIAPVKLAGSLTRTLYYVHGLFFFLNTSNGSAGLLDHSKMLLRAENHRRKGAVPELFSSPSPFFLPITSV